MNVVPINATTPDATSQLAQYAARSAHNSKPLTGEALRKASPEVQRREVAAQFEAILVRQLLGPTMTSMLGKDSGAAGSVYGDMLTDTFAQQLTRGGGGLGLSRLLEQQLTPRGRAAPVQPSSP
jgi:Rod binding domain-containing protein